MVLHRPFEPAPVTGKVAVGTLDVRFSRFRVHLPARRRTPRKESFVVSYLKSSALQGTRFLCLLFLVVGACHAQVPAMNSPLELLDHLAGQWVLQGTIAGK